MTLSCDLDIDPVTFVPLQVSQQDGEEGEGLNLVICHVQSLSDPSGGHVQGHSGDLVITTTTLGAEVAPEVSECVEVSAEVRQSVRYVTLDAGDVV